MKSISCLLKSALCFANKGHKRKLEKGKQRSVGSTEADKPASIQAGLSLSQTTTCVSEIEICIVEPSDGQPGGSQWWAEPPPPQSHSPNSANGRLRPSTADSGVSFGSNSINPRSRPPAHIRKMLRLPPGGDPRVIAGK